MVVLSSFWNLDKRVNKDYHSALPTWSMFIKKSILDNYKYLRYPLNIHPGEDGIFSHELLMYTNNVSFEYSVNYHYIKRSGQSTENTLANIKKLVDDIKKYLEELRSEIG